MRSWLLYFENVHAIRIADTMWSVLSGNEERSQGAGNRHARLPLHHVCPQQLSVGLTAAACCAESLQRLHASTRAASESGEEAILKTFQSLHEPQFFEERVISFTTLMQTVRGIATCRLRSALQPSS